MRLTALAISAAVLLASSACSGGGTSNRATTHTPGTGQASGLTPSAAATPTSPDRLPDPTPTAPPSGSKVIYTGSGRGARDLTLPTSAEKASSVSVSWSCAGPAMFSIVASGKTLAGSQCGDGSAVFTTKIPHTTMGDSLAWKFTADSSVVWRVSVLQPPEN